MIPKLWTIQDVSEYLGVPVGTLYSWRCHNQGPAARRVGKYLRYKPEDVIEWFDAITSSKSA